jgi:hypothetical protein
MRREHRNQTLPQTISFKQLNANKKGHIIHTLLNEHIKNTDIILIQEPRWGFIGTDEKGKTIKCPINHNQWTPIMPVTSQQNDDPPPRVMAYIKCREGFRTQNIIKVLLVAGIEPAATRNLQNSCANTTTPLKL